MSLPIFQDPNQNIMLLQTNWSSKLNPVINAPLSSSNLLANIPIVAGNNVINHKLGAKLQGWIISGMHGAYLQIYDTQSTNQMPQLTLNLHSSGAGSIDLVVF